MRPGELTQDWNWMRKETPPAQSPQSMEKDLLRENAELRAQNARLRDALVKIQAWRFPPTGRFWDVAQTDPMSYMAVHGTNGERDFMRTIACEAIAETPAASLEAISPGNQPPLTAGDIKRGHEVWAEHVDKIRADERESCANAIWTWLEANVQWLDVPRVRRSYES